MAINSSGTTTGPDETFRTQSAPAPGAPTLAKTANVIPVSGLVFIRPPHGESLDAVLHPLANIAKGAAFIPLTQARQVPIGSQIDARRGTLRLVAATGVGHTTQAVRLSGGLFTVAQSKAKVEKGLTTFTLNSGGFSGAPSYAGCPSLGKHALAKGKKPPTTVIQTLSATDHHGKFKVHGRYSAGTVEGTQFTTKERCDGTLTTVRRGTVDVLNYLHPQDDRGPRRPQLPGQRDGHGHEGDRQAHEAEERRRSVLTPAPHRTARRSLRRPRRPAPPRSRAVRCRAAGRHAPAGGWSSAGRCDRPRQPAWRPVAAWWRSCRGRP